MQQLEMFPEDIRIERVDHVANMYRFYRLRLMPDLFGGVSLLREWGRIIPPRENAKYWGTITAGAVARNEALRASKYLGRAIWRKWSGYHRRSRTETKMHWLKLLGQSLMARDFDRHVAELQIRASVLNGYAALGIPITEPVG